MTPTTSAEQLTEQSTPALSPTRSDKVDYAPLIRQSMLAFWRDLPQLLQDRPRQWVAYHGDQQLGFAQTRVELWQECLRRGLAEGEFLVRSIEPEDPDLVLVDVDSK